MIDFLPTFDPEKEGYEFYDCKICQSWATKEVGGFAAGAVWGSKCCCGELYELDLQHILPLHDCGAAKWFDVYRFKKVDEYTTLDNLFLLSNVKPIRSRPCRSASEDNKKNSAYRDKNQEKPPS
jgi:hypothetical protein